MLKEQNSGVWAAQPRYPQQQAQSQSQSQSQAQAQAQAHPMVQSRVRSNALNTRPLGLSPSAWPPLQQAQQQQQYQKNGSGMRAVFLGTQNAGAKRECAGTGVFLPRQIGTQSETRKKTGLSPSPTNKSLVFHSKQIFFSVFKQNPTSKIRVLLH